MTPPPPSAETRQPGSTLAAPGEDGLPLGRQRWSGTAAMLGGSLWICFYVTSVLLGERPEGEAPLDPRSSGLTLLSFLSFGGALLHIDTSLLSLQARFQQRGRWLVRGAQGLAGLALIAVSSQLVLMLGLLGRSWFIPQLGAVGVLSTCASAAMLGIAGRREPVLPRWGNTLLLATGALTMVLVILSTLPYGPIPAYVVNDLPFGIVGTAWIFIGMAMRQ